MSNCVYCGHPQTDQHNSSNDEPCEETCPACMEVGQTDG